MKKTKNNLVIATVLFGLVFSIFAPVQNIQADTESELRTKTQSISEKIDANKDKLQALEGEVSTLKNRIEGLKTEIAIANDQISLISAKISLLNVEIAEAEKELERQKNLLKESLRALYKQGRVSIIELLAASDSYSEFIDEQEYLERLKTGIQESADKIEELKVSLEASKGEQESLLADQERQKKILQEKTSEQKSLLAETEGEESKYRGIVSDLESQRQAAESELQAYLASLIQDNYTSLGYVNVGAGIGLVGSSGFSTGPHMHFAITDGTAFYNPLASGNSLAYGMQWPLPNSSFADISQGYGCVAPSDWYIQKCNGGANSFHSGLDISGWYGDPVVAAKAGDIVFRGWLGGYGNTVIIDHGDGLFTYYPHLLE